MRLHSAKARVLDRICVCVRACVWLLGDWTGSGCCWLLSDDCSGLMWKCSLYLSASVSLPLSLSLTHTHTRTHTHTHTCCSTAEIVFSPLISPLGILWSGQLSAEWCLAQQVMTEAHDCHVKIMNIWCRRELLQVVCLLLWLTHIDESWVPVIPSHTGCLIAICFCKKVVDGKLYRFGLRWVPQACKGLIHTLLSTIVLVFAVHLFILLVDLKDKVTACHQLSIHLLSTTEFTGLLMNVSLILHK